MVRSEAAADDVLAAILARIRLGMAIAAMIRMIATTISSSISEKPFCLRIFFFPLLLDCPKKVGTSFRLQRKSISILHLSGQIGKLRWFRPHPVIPYLSTFRRTLV